MIKHPQLVASFFVLFTLFCGVFAVVAVIEVDMEAAMAEEEEVAATEAVTVEDTVRKHPPTLLSCPPNMAQLIPPFSRLLGGGGGNWSGGHRGRGRGGYQQRY